MGVANAVYEIGGACTSVVAELPDGTIVHGRNFDYPEQYARSATQARFVRTGESGAQTTKKGKSRKKTQKTPRRPTAGPVPRQPMLPIVGLIDGVRPGVCSISVNTRHKQAHQQPIGGAASTYFSLEGGLVAMLRRNWSVFLFGGFAGNAFCEKSQRPLDVSHLIRRTLEDARTFGGALRRLATAPQAGLSYLTVGGTERGRAPW